MPPTSYDSFILFHSSVSLLWTGSFSIFPQHILRKNRFLHCKSNKPLLPLSFLILLSFGPKTFRSLALLFITWFLDSFFLLFLIHMCILQSSILTHSYPSWYSKRSHDEERVSRAKEIPESIHRCCLRFPQMRWFWVLWRKNWRMSNQT